MSEVADTVQNVTVSLHELLTTLNNIEAVYAKVERMHPANLRTSIQNVKDTLVAAFHLIRVIEDKKCSPIDMPELLSILNDAEFVYAKVVWSRAYRKLTQRTSIQNVEDTLTAVLNWAQAPELRDDQKAA